MPLERRRIKKVLVTAGLAAPSAIVSHVNGSLSVMARVRGSAAVEEQVVRLARRVKTAVEAEGIEFQVVKAGHSPRNRQVFITITNAAMLAQSGRGAHPGVVVLPAQGDREVYVQLFGGEAGVVVDLTEQATNLPELTEAEQEAMETVEASEV